MRFAKALSLLLVFCLASSLTLACAFACQDPETPAPSHCHQTASDTKASPAAADGPAFARSTTACPMLAELERRPASLAASAAANVSVSPQAILPLETAMLLVARAPALVETRPVPPFPLPLYLKKRVLRL